MEVANPFNAGQIRRVSLLPKEAGMKLEEGVDAFVFWTRDPRNILANADELTRRGFPFYVMTTLTGYPVALEPDMPPTLEIASAMRELAQKIGPERVIWRYDPILLSNITDEVFHRDNFSALAWELAGAARRVIISVYSEYRKAAQRFEKLESSGILRLTDISAVNDLLAVLPEIAGAAGMEIQSCAAKENYSPLGIRPGACIDAELIKKISGLELNRKDKNQRPGCLCCQSVDIGRYGNCGAGCVYCYAW